MKITCAYDKWKGFKSTLGENYRALYISLGGSYMIFLVNIVTPNDLIVTSTLSNSTDISDFESSIKPSAIEVASVG